EQPALDEVEPPAPETREPRRRGRRAARIVLPPGAAPQQVADARGQLARLERLGEIVVGAEL
nr:hypothetical protein [Tanacetum cinerariifolium]